MLILGVETSCDETAAAVVQDGRLVRSSIILSQVALHAPYGGVVPEIASRQHSEMLPDVVDRAMRDAGAGWGDLDAVAVTYGPGLASSLLVGLSMAKGLALRLAKPLIAINHLQAHIYSPFLADGAPRPEEVGPFVALVISGGHTCLVRCDALGQYQLLGETIDDAAGEAFDKGANLLGLGYPGGPVMDRIGRQGNPLAVDFPRGRVKRQRTTFAGLDPDLCFSYSGVKTALLYHLRDQPLQPEDPRLPDIVASYQEAIVDTVIERCERAMTDVDTLCVGGGVSLNSRLRARLQELARQRGLRLLLAKPAHCADNAAMIAGLAGAGGGLRGDHALGADVIPALPVCVT
ncbi:MAG: tRNA (adenosine(37)-N6)-threonylcarbamoyltransferase complex transferase subunit TsaD [Lentisphaerae bacterium]|nr:tRNA (adenosine(37)-N6)-threonylcarbamoyltransferase complex transferase subunit TsaD [Lentisphaerota bacterium]